MTVDKFLFIREKTTVYKVELNEIKHIKSEGNYCYIETNEKSFQIKISLGKLLESLPGPNFIQVNRNFIIPINRIEKINLTEGLILLENESISIGGRYKETLLNAMQILP
ncbi:MAG: LytTR family DNA-binding domain-containing protein [Saprospiraceae bacterium]